MTRQTGRIIGIKSNIVSVEVDGRVMLNEVGHILHGTERLKAEVVNISGKRALMQVFETTRGVKAGDTVEFSGRLLSATLGPGLLGQIFDGLQNPLPEVARACGYFLPRGAAAAPLDDTRKWTFTPLVQRGDMVEAGDWLGFVPEGTFRHYVMVPFHLRGEYIVDDITAPGNYPVSASIARLRDEEGMTLEVSMAFEWPVKRPVTAFADKQLPRQPLVTKVRIIDTFFPIARGGTFCVPGPFGAGKTVLQQTISRYAEVDVVVIAACGERAGEVVETLREFPQLTDPRTGSPLMQRTIVIANTSSMPVAAREASLYTAATLGEYYRQMGLDVLLLADSTSRWAQAMRETSGRLGEIPGEEAFPAYLESRIAQFYERSGVVELSNGKGGSLTISGTVSPAGGNFDEPVTQATLKVVGAFLGLSRERANARRFPSIHPLESWSRYAGVIPASKVKQAHDLLLRGDEVRQMIMVVGEESTSAEDFLVYLKAEFLDAVYLQQNSFDAVDAATIPQRQVLIFDKVLAIITRPFVFATKEQARVFFNRLRQLFIDWNYMEMDSERFVQQAETIDQLIAKGQEDA